MKSDNPSFQSPARTQNIAIVESDADHDEDAEHLLLHRRVVGDRAKQRRDQGDDDDRDRRRPGEAARGQRVAKVRGDDVVEVDRENGGDDRRLEGGVRPVVHRPGAQLRSAKTEAFQELFHDSLSPGCLRFADIVQKVLRATHSRKSESTTA